MKNQENMTLTKEHNTFQFSSVQFSRSVVSDYATPWIAARQASLSITNSWSSPRLMSIESVMPSNHLIICCPFLLPSVFPSIRVFSNESALRVRWPKYWNFSFSISPGCSLEGLRLRLKLQYFATSWEELTHWKRPRCWEGLGAGGKGDDRGWDGWLASPTRCTWVWVNSGSWWWTRRPGVMWFMGLQRVGHDWATELNWTETVAWGFINFFSCDENFQIYFFSSFQYTMQYC